MKCEEDTILIVSEFVSSEQNSTGYYWSGIIDKLSSDFKKVKVVCASLPKKSKKNIKVEYEEVNSISYNKKKLLNLFNRLFIEIKSSWQFFTHTKNNIKTDIILFTGTNPPLFLFLIFLFKKTRRFKWVVLVHDVFPDNLVAANIISRTNFIYKLAKWLFDNIYSSANSIIVIGRDMKELMEEKTQHKIEVDYIPNWASLSDIQKIPRESSVYIKNLGWNEYVVFQFFGNLGRVQDIPNILKAIKLVKSEKAAFLFIGNGIMENDIQKFISINKDLNVAYLGGVNAENRSEALSACDVAIVSLSKGMKGLGVPSKAYFSMAANKLLLVVSDDGSELVQVVDEFNIGWSCDSENPASLADLIDNICETDLSEKKEIIYSVFKEQFSEELSLSKISNVIRRL